MEGSPMPGCVLLGVAGSVDAADIEQQKKRRPIYVTRHRIDSYRQSQPLCREVTADTFLPCARRDQNRPVSCVWHVFRSELLLFALHMSTLVFGVVKEALDMRQIDELRSTHLAHTIIETIVTLLIIVIRTVNVRMDYVEVQVTVQRLQHFDAVHEPHLRAVWTWMWLLFAAGVLAFVTCVVCFVAFDRVAHLGWTVLSNQSCILTIHLLRGFYESRVRKGVEKIKEDQQKVVIYEALMLLQQQCSAAEADDGDDGVKRLPSTATSSSATVLRFISAVFNTKPLAKPKYIVLTATSKQPATEL